MVNQHKYDYDAFISYAVEDKPDIVNELVIHLKEAGLKVCYVSEKLMAGKCVSESIREGLRRSRHGIVVLSPTYFAKEWTRKEFNILWANESKTEDRKIFPVWYNVTLREVQEFDPYLADIFGLDSRKGMDFVVAELVKSLREDPKKLKNNIIPAYKTILSICSSIILAGLKINFSLTLENKERKIDGTR